MVAAGGTARDLWRQIPENRPRGDDCADPHGAALPESLQWLFGAAPCEDLLNTLRKYICEHHQAGWDAHWQRPALALTSVIARKMKRLP